MASRCCTAASPSTWPTASSAWLIFLGFLYGISRWKDIRRVFEYHGAEHKVVFNFESGKPVTVENAQPFTTFHPRCGTSFLLVVMVISMVVYALHPVRRLRCRSSSSRIALLPVIAGLSYELIRFAAKRRGSACWPLLTAPGLWLQRITTQAALRRPDRRRHPRPRRRHGARSRRRAANSSSPN